MLVLCKALKLRPKKVTGSLGHTEGTAIISHSDTLVSSLISLYFFYLSSCCVSKKLNH